MNYWRGIMTWPLIEDWKCEICGKNYDLTWGMQSGECRCNNCHAEYTMVWFDEEEKPVVLDAPKCMEYVELVRFGWNILKKPISDWDWDVWQTVESQFEIENQGGEEE